MRWSLACAALALCLALAPVCLAGGPVPFEDPATGLWGYKDKATGKVAVAARYVAAQDFNASGRAFAATAEAWEYIDATGRVLLRPYVFDNGPDAFSQGLARFVKGGKIGYFNEKGEAAVPADYDFALPFENGRAAVCRGCAMVQEGEHARVEGGLWGCIDAKGRVLKPLTSPRPDCGR